MPDESCRRCGGVLITASKCSECRKPLEQFCRVCKNVISDVIHTCMYGGLKTISARSWVANA
ncbi:MAG: hypothetical protein QXW91_02225 [Candidatus Nitrosotenuis sp.]